MREDFIALAYRLFPTTWQDVVLLVVTLVVALVTVVAFLKAVRS